MAPAARPPPPPRLRALIFERPPLPFWAASAAPGPSVGRFGGRSVEHSQLVILINYILEGVATLSIQICDPDGRLWSTFVYSRMYKSILYPNLIHQAPRSFPNCFLSAPEVLFHMIMCWRRSDLTNMHDNGHLLTYTWDTVLTHAREGLQLCGSRYCSRPRECACWACSLSWLSARAIRARPQHRSASGPQKRAAPMRVKAGTRKELAAAELRRPVTSLTTADPLRKSRPMKASMAWVNETRPAKVSSARWACGGEREGKVHAMHRGFGLRDGVRVLDSGGYHRKYGPGARRQPPSLSTASSPAWAE